MKRMTVLTLIAFVLALFFGVAAAIAQDNSGGMDNSPGGGMSNTPNGGYERQGMAAGPVYAQDDSGGMDNSPNGGGTSNTPNGGYERQGMAAGPVYAQGGMGMSNATGMPTLSGDYSSTFESGSMDSAQQICDRLARENNKASCQATSVTTQSATPGAPPKDLFYCVCQ